MTNPNPPWFNTIWSTPTPVTGWWPVIGRVLTPLAATVAVAMGVPAVVTRLANAPTPATLTVTGGRPILATTLTPAAATPMALAGGASPTLTTSPIPGSASLTITAGTPIPATTMVPARASVTATGTRPVPETAMKPAAASVALTGGAPTLITTLTPAAATTMVAAGGSSTLTTGLIPSPAGTYGVTSSLANPFTGYAGYLVAQQVTLPQSGALQSISFEVGTPDGTMYLGIYDNTGAGGGPGARLATTAQFTPVNGWNTVATTTNPTLAAGTYYLAWAPSSSALTVYYANQGSGIWYRTPGYAALPSTFGTPSTNPAQFSIYATFPSMTVTGSPPVPTATLTPVGATAATVTAGTPTLITTLAPAAASLSATTSSPKLSAFSVSPAATITAATSSPTLTTTLTPAAASLSITGTAPTLLNGGLTPPGYDGIGTAETGANTSFSVATTATAGDYVVFDIVLYQSATAPSNVKYGTTAMTLLSSVALNNVGSNGILYRYGLASVAGGSVNITGTTPFAHQLGQAIFLSGVVSLGATTTVFGSGTSLSQGPVTDSATGLILQTFGTGATNVALTSLSGGTNRYNNAGLHNGLTINTATASTTFTGTGSGTPTWGGIATVFNPS